VQALPPEHDPEDFQNHKLCQGCEEQQAKKDTDSIIPVPIARIPPSLMPPT